MTDNRKNLKKRALAVSIVLLTLWCLLGTHSTVAWFSDKKEKVNTFVYGDVRLQVEYYDPKMGSWQNLAGSDKVFDEEALYEPGYTQVAKLRITNIGDAEFEYRLAVTINDVTTATNVYQQSFTLADDGLLKYGVILDPTEDGLLKKLATRTKARELAALPVSEMISLNRYFYPREENKRLKPEQTAYAALVVYMPEEVGNEANYRGSVVPQILLGINVRAAQVGAAEEALMQ